MLRKNLHFILLLLLLIDAGYSFRQHINIELDGDMADIILPSPFYQKVLEDPFGLSVLFNNEVYAAPNRFFYHWTYSNYFKVIPGILQNFISPVDSIYLASAIAKTFTQIFLILLFAAYICGKKNLLSKEYLTAAILVTPLFITNQYWRLGIIDWSITFVFCYALPLGLLFLFYLPFFKNIFYGEKVSSNVLYRIYLILLAIVVSFNCPLSPGVVIVICPIVLLNLFYRRYRKDSDLSIGRRIVSAIEKIPKEILFYFILLTMLSLYSLYIGRNNIENTTVEKTILDRYLLLPMGFTTLFEQSTLLIPLIVMTLINALIIFRNFKNEESRKILVLLKWILICSVIYILLLPLGGYRAYRPYILRYDTVLPVTYFLIIFFGISSYYLIINLTGIFRIIFSSVLAVFLLFYVKTDGPVDGLNSCQRNAMYEISESKDSIVALNSDCNVMTWVPVKDYKDSELNAELFKYWGITKDKKLYYQK